MKAWREERDASFFYIIHFYIILGQCNWDLKHSNLSDLRFVLYLIQSLFRYTHTHW